MSVRTSLATLMMTAALVAAAAVPGRAQPPASLCGTKPEMVDVMMRLIEEGVEKLYSDNKMFVSRDNRDGSMWAISLPKTSAHPAAACRTKANETAMICTAGEKICASFLQQATERIDKVGAGTP